MYVGIWVNFEAATAGELFELFYQNGNDWKTLSSLGLFQDQLC